MTFREATEKLIANPKCELDINTLSQEDQEKLAVWVKVCNMVLHENVSMYDELKREE